jgi:hypothetical protein
LQAVPEGNLPKWFYHFEDGVSPEVEPITTMLSYCQTFGPLKAGSVVAAIADALEREDKCIQSQFLDSPVLVGGRPHEVLRYLHRKDFDYTKAGADPRFLAIAVPSSYQGDIMRLTEYCIRCGVAGDHMLLDRVQLAKSGNAKRSTAWLLYHSEVSARLEKYPSLPY